jgi:hypothetical protein
MRFCLIDWRKVVILDVNISDYYSYELFDANGNRLDYVVRADTETGQIERYVLDGSGKPSRTIEGKLLTEIVFVPYPLKAIKHDNYLENN